MNYRVNTSRPKPCPRMNADGTCDACRGSRGCICPTEFEMVRIDASPVAESTTASVERPTRREPIIGRGGPAELGEAMTAWCAPEIEAAHRELAERQALEADEAKRLRRVVRALGMESEVPDDDASLRGCLFSVLGQISRKLERDLAERKQPAGTIDTPEFLAMLDNYARDGTNGYEYWYRKIIAHIDGHTAGAVPEGYVLVPKKITQAMIEGALVAHYGKKRCAQAGGAGGIDMTVNDINYSGTHAMRRFWAGALGAAPTNQPKGDGNADQT